MLSILCRDRLHWDRMGVFQTRKNTTRRMMISSTSNTDRVTPTVISGKEVKQINNSLI